LDGSSKSKLDIRLVSAKGCGKKDPLGTVEGENCSSKTSRISDVWLIVMSFIQYNQIKIQL
jgi:hypothetical protein